jgi:hypothetical protein
VNCRDYKQRTPLHVAAELGMLLVWHDVVFKAFCLPLNSLGFLRLVS